MYFQLNYLLAYGQFRAGSGLERYYRRLGFDVLAPERASPSANASLCLSASRLNPANASSSAGGK